MINGTDLASAMNSAIRLMKELKGAPHAIVSIDSSQVAFHDPETRDTILAVEASGAGYFEELIVEVRDSSIRVLDADPMIASRFLSVPNTTFQVALALVTLSEDRNT